MVTAPSPFIIALAAAALTSAAAAQPCAPYWQSAGWPSATFPRRGFWIEDCHGSALFLNHGQGGGHIGRFQDGVLEPANTGLPSSSGQGLLMTLDLGQGPELYAYSLTEAGANRHLSRWECDRWVEVWPGIMQEEVTFPYAARIQGQHALYSLRTLPNGDREVVQWSGFEWIAFGKINSGFNVGMVAYDDGNGDGLFLLGNFTLLDGQPYRGFARWDGNKWTDPMPHRYRVGSGQQAPFYQHMVVVDHGSGPVLYTRGTVFDNGLSLGSGVKRWDGHIWIKIGEEQGALASSYWSLHSFDDGRGPALYLGGDFHNIDGIPCRSICRFDGEKWEPLHLGVNNMVRWIVSTPTPQGNALAVMGGIHQFGGFRLDGLAYWVGCPNCYANCNDSTTEPILTVNDFTCFINRFAAGDPYANCDGSTTEPLLTINDFTCFINKFAQGCP